MKRKIISGALAGLLLLSSVPMFISSTRAEIQQSITEGGCIVPQSMSEEQSKALTDNAIKIFQTLYDEKQDNLISPLSIQYAVAMLTDAAKGDTLKEISNFYGLSKQELDESFSYINQSQVVPEQIANPIVESDFRNIYKISNSIWSNSASFSGNISKKLQEAIKQHYDADLYKTNLSKQEGIDEINKYVDEHTLNLINKIFDEPLDRDVCAVLLNTIGFECGWVNTFDDAIPDQNFTTSDGKISKVPLMFSAEQEYVETDNARGACMNFMPYSSEFNKRRFSMYAVLPKDGDLQSYLDNLSAEELSNITQVKDDIDAHVYFPKFDFENTIQISNALKALGVRKAFSDSSDIYLTDNTRHNQKISDAIQKTKIEVTEAGTKAAAVTALSMATCSISLDIPKFEEVRFDKPFFYMIWDNIDNVPIFMGTCEQLS